VDGWRAVRGKIASSGSRERLGICGKISAMAQMVTLAHMACDGVLDTTYDWLCRRRRDYRADADVWSLRRSWVEEKERVRTELLAGRYRFALLTRVTLSDGEEVDLWSARDALVLKALAIVLARHLPVSSCCTHVKGHGGAKAAVRQVAGKLAANRFVLKTDVKSYYASIDHFLLLDRLAAHIHDKAVLNLIGQYLRRTAERGGEFWDYDRGISLGCPLSPLIGAFFLDDLDRRMARLDLFYVRFMDDLLVLAPTRWKLRRAVKLVNRVLGALRLEKHPDKTFIGRIERGFDFLGYHFGPAGLSVATATIERFVARAVRLYEQEPGELLASARLGLYVRRWVRWTAAGLAVADSPAPNSGGSEQSVVTAADGASP
jgi:RNA-directed DNA polymerase